MTNTEHNAICQRHSIMKWALGVEILISSLPDDIFVCPRLLLRLHVFYILETHSGFYGVEVCTLETQQFFKTICKEQVLLRLYMRFKTWIAADKYLPYKYIVPLSDISLPWKWIKDLFWKTCFCPHIQNDMQDKITIFCQWSLVVSYISICLWWNKKVCVWILSIMKQNNNLSPSVASG